MNKEQFDKAICSNIKGKLGYKVSDGEKVYDVYYSNDEFERFLQEMKSRHFGHYSEYDKGNGSEFRERTAKSGAVSPPKTASAASSSRFCYISLVNGALPLGVSGSPQFEYGCSIKGMRAHPQLDAYFCESNAYFEVKCHEIFDKHTISFTNRYLDIITGRNNPFGFSERDIALKKDSSFTVSPEKFGVAAKSPMFDIKQLICHLLGIASQNGGKQAKLIYLFFYPVTDNNDINKEIEEVFNRLKAETTAIFNSSPIKTFCKNQNIVLSAYAEKSRVMTELTNDNVIQLYP